MTAKINLTKLLFIDARVIRKNSEKGTTGDTSYIPRNQTAGGDEPYSFELEAFTED